MMDWLAVADLWLVRLDWMDCGYWGLTLAAGVAGGAAGGAAGAVAYAVDW